MFNIKTILITVVLIHVMPVHADTWTLLTDNKLSIKHVAIDAQHPEILFINTDDVLYQSQDSGMTWVAIDIGKTTNERIKKTVINSQNSKIIYTVTVNHQEYESTLYKSNDGGSTWEKMFYQFDSRIADFKINSHNPSILYAVTGSTAGSFYKSMDAGNSWHEVGISDHATMIDSIVVDPNNPSIVYLNTFDTMFLPTISGIFKSSDQGKSWERKIITGNGFPYIYDDKKLPMAIHPHNTNIIYTSDPRSFGQTLIPFLDNQAPTVIKTIDAGETWQNVNHGSFPASYEFAVKDIAIHPHTPNIVYLGSTKGVYRTINDGEKWNLLSNMVDGEELHITNIVIDPHHPENIYLGTIDKGLYRFSTHAHCTANYDALTKEVTIPCLTLNHTSPLYEVGLKQHDELLFEVLGVQDK